MRLGGERLDEHLALFAGKRIGLVTNHVGRDTIAALRERFALVALLSPEHGLSGVAGEGEAVPSGVDAETGLRVLSLYGEVTRPTAAMLEGIDLLVYDLQDAGARCYTFVSTLAEVMRAAAGAGIPVVVLDRPAPTGGLDLDGPILDTRFTSFVGAAPIPLRYGMTPGELARFYRDALGIAAELHVVELDGWERAMWFDDTGRSWIPPSPGLRTLEACALYPGTVLFEATNVSEGRGTAEPFVWIGAPWLDPTRVIARVGDRAVHIVPETRAPGRFLGAPTPGLRLELADRRALRPVALAVALLGALRDVHGDALEIDAPRFDRLAGTDALRRALESGQAAAAVVASWRDALAAFARLRAPYLLY